MNFSKNKTIKNLLIEGSKKISWSPTSFLDAELLLSFALKKNRTYLSTNPDLELSKNIIDSYFNLIDRRIKKEPIAYITGQKEFLGLDFIVNKDVLIPRPETELLVEEGIRLINKEHINKIVDIGTGSGCVILSLAKKIYDKNSELARKIRWYTTEVSKGAISVAKKNYKKIFSEKEVEIKFIKGSLLESIDKKVDLIISNPPYIGEMEYETLEENVKDYEPLIALIGGVAGYEVTLKLLQEAKKKLNKGGYVLLEINSKHIDKIKEATQKTFPKHKIRVIKDYSGLDRIVSIQKF